MYQSPQTDVKVFQGPFSAWTVAIGSIEPGMGQGFGAVAVDPTDATGAVYVSTGDQILKFSRPTKPDGFTANHGSFGT
jgi:hypothetical protein